MRADGGIVVLPPTAGYSWIADDDGPFPPIPPRWLAAIQGAGAPPPPARRPPPPKGKEDAIDDIIARLAPIAEGGRNGALYRIGVRLRHDGRTEVEILDALERINVACVAPSLSDREVQTIARSATRGTR